MVKKIDGNYCGVKISTPTGTPSGLKTHLKTIHDIDPSVSNSTNIEPAAKITKFALESSITFKTDIKTRLARMVCVDNFSINAISKSKEINALCKIVYNKSVPSFDTIRKYAIDHYEDVKAEIINSIKTLSKSEMPTISFDEWTSVGTVQILNVIVHFKDVNFNIGVREITNISCTAEVLKHNIFSLLYDHGITHGKKLMVTADGASTNKKLAKISNINLQLCINHGLNLSIVDVFYVKKDGITETGLEYDDFSEDELESDDEIVNPEPEELDAAVVKNWKYQDEEIFENQETPVILKSELRMVLKKVRKVSSRIRNSAKHKRALKQYTELMPKLDVQTRWSSMANMCSRFIEILPFIKKSYIDLGISFNIDQNEISILKLITELLNPVCETVRTLSKVNSNLLTADTEITKLVNTLNSKTIFSNSNIKNEFVTAIENRFIQRRTRYSDILQFLKTQPIIC